MAVGPFKGWFALDQSRSRSRNQKRRVYDLVKKVFRFRLRSAYDLVKTRLSESEAERFILPLLLPTATIWFSLDHERNVSGGVVSGVGRNGNVLILLTPIPSRL